MRAGLPGAPDWVFDIPLIGQMLGDLWNRWAADITVMAEALRPYFGIVLEGGLGLLLGLANGVLLFVLALFIAFFFYLYGEPIAARLRMILRRDRRHAGATADCRHRRDGAGRRVRHPVDRDGAGDPDRIGAVGFRGAAAGIAGRGRRVPGGAADRGAGGVDSRPRSG